MRDRRLSFIEEENEWTPAPGTTAVDGGGQASTRTAVDPVRRLPATACNADGPALHVINSRRDPREHRPPLSCGDARRIGEAIRGQRQATDVRLTAKGGCA